MQRLLQGDVGSGKTVVALYALLRAVESGRQGALMAPTETLAEQHFLTIEGICAELGVSCALVTGSVKSKIGGQADVVVGTHALIQKGFEFRDLAVAVVDEQHRFGVEQRSALAGGARAARPPHDRDADPAHARADGLRRPRGQRDREAAREPQADRDGVGDRRAQLGGLHAPARAPRRGPAGIRRLPADRGVGDVARRAPPSRRPSGCGPRS